MPYDSGIVLTAHRDVHRRAMSQGAAYIVASAAIARVQAEGTCWLGRTTWHGQAAMRVSISNWSTTDADVDRSAQAIAAAITAVVEETTSEVDLRKS